MSRWGPWCTSDRTRWWARRRGSAWRRRSTRAAWWASGCRWAMVYIGPHAVVGEATRIGVAAAIHAGCVVGKRVSLGEGSVLHANVTVYDNVDIGRGSVLHSGCVIGADGFGYVMENERWHKFPQVGRVEIADFVEIGANSCVDRD